MVKQQKRRSLNGNEKNLIIECIADLLRETPNIVAAYVFGSFVRDETFRDIDIGVLVDESPSPPLEYELELETALERALKVPSDVRVLNGAPQSFAYTVIAEGKIVFDRDPNLRAIYESRTIRQYLDFSRFRKLSLRSMADAGV